MQDYISVTKEVCNYISKTQAHMHIIHHIQLNNSLDIQRIMAVIIPSLNIFIDFSVRFLLSKTIQNGNLICCVLCCLYVMKFKLTFFFRFSFVFVQCLFLCPSSDFNFWLEAFFFSSRRPKMLMVFLFFSFFFLYFLKKKRIAEKLKSRE